MLGNNEGKSPEVIMNTYIKWIAIIGGGLIVVFIAALLIIPMFVDVNQFKPQIESQVAEATGRSFTLGGDIDLSLFPWAGLSLTDLTLGNPPEFEEKAFVTVKSFEARLKLLPLLFKDVQVKRFVLKGPRIVLVKLKNGQANWEGLGKPAEATVVPPPAGPVKAEEKEDKPSEGVSLKRLAVGKFVITDGAVVWIDHASNVRKEIKDISLKLQDVSLDRPIRLVFSALVDQWPLLLEGSIGPIGKELGHGTIPVDLSIKAMAQLSVALKGNIVNPAEKAAFDMTLEIEPFSPRKLLSALNLPLPMATADPKVLNLLSLGAELKGDTQQVSISNGMLQLDQSKLSFNIRIKDFSKPDVTFKLNLDEIDLDRYLPPPSEDKDEEKTVQSESRQPSKTKTDYTPLRKLVLNGVLKVGKIKVSNARIQNVELNVTAKNGVISMDPFTADLYQGHVRIKGSFDVRKDLPRSLAAVQIKNIQVGPLLEDVIKKDFLEGLTNAEINIGLTGDTPESIKKTLNGKGNIFFNDGAIKGIDLAGMLRNVKATFGLAEKGAEKPRTDFAELRVPFTITNGVVYTRDTGLMSPLIRVTAAGNADLVKETLDFRVEPEFVATITGQGDTEQRSGFTVPVLISGSFTSPKFRPDLAGMLKQNLTGGLPKVPDIKKVLEGGNVLKEGSKSLEETAKGLLKGLPF